MKSIRKLNHSLWLVFVGCSLSYLLIQLETLYFIFSQEIKGGRNIIEELGIVFFSQGQNLLLAGILALGFYFLRHNKITRGLYVLILAVMLFYLTVNQLFYERFFDHIQFGLVEGEANLSLLWGSFLAELDRVFFINLSLVGCSVFVFAYQLIPNQKPIESAETKHQNKIAIGLLFCWTLVSLWFNTRYNDERNWVNHPFITLTTSLFPNQEEIHIRKKELVNTDIYSLRYGTAPRDITFEGKIPANYPNGYREKPPNVIYIILESVGAKNIFPNPSFNELDSLLTPNLYKWRSQLISFPTIYNIFPGTTSSHFTIHTGGCADVIRNINRLSEVPYMGFTLPELFKKMNYETALFSSLFLYRTKYWYAQMPFDKKFIPDELPKKDLDRNKLTSWGIREEVSIEKSLDWLSNRTRENPFFMQLLTCSGHHPYKVPSGVDMPFGEDSDINLYRNTLHYMDKNIGKLFQYLSDNDLLNNTIIAISGDHGEAFGRFHSTNFIHREHIYEENIRNFLLVYDFQKPSGEWVSQKQGFLGDIMPTLLSYAKDSTKLIGQNLLKKEYQPKIRYMHKSGLGYKWGLVDGQWKYITERGNSLKSELYNLKKDPNEQHNLSQQFPSRMKEYHELCNDWYIIENEVFDNQWLDEKTFQTDSIQFVENKPPGPKKLRFGVEDVESQNFIRMSRMSPNQDFVARTLGFPYRDDRVIEYEWIRPDGASYCFDHIHTKAQWINTIPCKIDRPLMLGSWYLSLKEKGTGKELIRGFFNVKTTKE